MAIKFCVLDNSVKNGVKDDLNHLVFLAYLKKEECLVVEEQYFDEDDKIERNIIELAVNKKELIHMRDFLNSLDLEGD